jgi:hypothetical protein
LSVEDTNVRPATGARSRDYFRETVAVDIGTGNKNPAAKP